MKRPLEICADRKWMSRSLHDFRAVKRRFAFSAFLLVQFRGL